MRRFSMSTRDNVRPGRSHPPHGGRRGYAVAHSAWSATIRLVDAGCFTSMAAGRVGRWTKFPPQFGQTPWKRSSTHSAQNVHS